MKRLIRALNLNLNLDFAHYFSETLMIVSLALASILVSFCLGLGCLIPKNRREKNNNQEVELQDRNSLNLMNILHADDKGGLISERFSPRLWQFGTSSFQEGRYKISFIFVK